jgi:hypothetical protein
MMKTMLQTLSVLGILLGVFLAELHDTDFRILNISPPGDQGGCGGCYGFAEVSNFEVQQALVLLKN